MVGGFRHVHQKQRKANPLQEIMTDALFDWLEASIVVGVSSSQKQRTKTGVHRHWRQFITKTKSHNNIQVLFRQPSLYYKKKRKNIFILSTGCVRQKSARKF